MADLETQLRRYSSILDEPPPIDPVELLARARRSRNATPSRYPWLIAAAVLVLFIFGAALVALRAEEVQEPLSPMPPAVEPTGWDKIADIDSSANAMAASPDAVVAVGYDAWWSADGHNWQRSDLPGLDSNEPVSRGVVTDVIATEEGFLAVGVDGDKQPAVWTSADGKAWERRSDDDLTLPTGTIPDGVSTPYGSIAAVVATSDGFMAVGGAFTGTFSGETLMSPTPFEPAVWTSRDGVDWQRTPDLPDEGGQLVGVVDTPDGPVAIGTAGQRSYVWRESDGRWRRSGEFPGVAAAVGQTSGTLVVTGHQSTEDHSSILTIWSSTDGQTWKVSYDNTVARLGDLRDLSVNGGALMALGYAGQYEIDSDSVMMSSTDGTTWSAMPTLPLQPATCAGDGPTACSSTSHYPVAAVVFRNELLLATSEMVTQGPAPGDPRSVSRTSTGIYRALTEPQPSPPASAPPAADALTVPTADGRTATLSSDGNRGLCIEIGSTDFGCSSGLDGSPALGPKDDITTPQFTFEDGERRVVTYGVLPATATGVELITADGTKIAAGAIGTVGGTRAWLLAVPAVAITGPNPGANWELVGPAGPLTPRLYLRYVGSGGQLVVPPELR